MDLHVSDSESDRPIELLASTYIYIVIELEKHPTDVKHLYFYGKYDNLLRGCVCKKNILQM